MTVRKRALLFVLATILSTSIGSPAFAVSAVPKATQMRLRGVSFVDTKNGWVVGEGILKTIDGGKSWSRQFVTVEDLNSIDMGTADVGCAVGDHGVIVRTTTGGESWVTATVGGGADLYDVDFVDGSYGWAVGSLSTVLRTTDGGATWTKCTVPVTPKYEGRRIFDVSFVDRLHGWACGESMWGGDGFFDLYVIKTSDGGVTWTRCSNGPDKSGGGDDIWQYTGIDFVSTTTGWVTGSGGTHKTTNGATSWVEQSVVDLSEVDFFNASAGVGTWFYTGTPYYTNNGGATWKPSDLAIHSVSDYEKSLDLGEICMSSSTHVWAVAENHQWRDTSPKGLIAHSTDGGAHWTTQPSSTGPVFFLGGETRYDSAVNIAKLTDVPAGTVVLATGRDYPDALAASGLAGVMDATLLLTNNTLPAQVSKAIADLGATHVIIVGGEDVVSDSIRDTLAKDYDVERIGGVNRYETAANIARRMVAEGASPDEVFICCGTNYADAASASALSYGQQIPILLVKPGELPYPTKRVLGELGSADAYVVGSSVAVGNGVMRAIESAATSPTIDAVRVADGVNRYSTSTLLASWASRKGWIDFGRVGIATGADFPDALTGGALMGSRGQTVLLTDPARLSSATDAFIAGKSVEQAWIMNDRGTGAVQDPVGTRLAYLLK